MPDAEKSTEHHILRDLEDRIGYALDVFYDKIGLHHHSISGPVRTRYKPAADVATTEIGLEIVLELPGLTDADIEVLASDAAITVQGEKKIERETGDDNWHRRERIFGRFERVFGITDDLDAEKAGATFKNGVLTISVPMKPESERKSRKIDIAAS